MTVSVQGADGHWTHTISQSWLSTAMECLESARRDALPGAAWRDSDTSISGSAMHWGIQEAIDSVIEDGQHWPLDWVQESVAERFDLLMNQREVYVSGGENKWEPRDEANAIQWKNRRDPEVARAYAVNCVTAWHTVVYPTLDPWATEVSFGPLRLLRDDVRTVLVKGTVDYLDRKLGPVDWKTSSRAYLRWEKERWNTQRTVYGWALRHRGFTNVPEIDTFPGPLDTFTFFVMGDFKESPQKVPVSSTDEHDRWLKQQVKSLLPLMESGAEVWPKIDHNVLCSPKWCEHWDDCKGRDIRTPDWAQPVDFTSTP